MRAEARFCGLALSVAAEGAQDACAALQAALASHAPKEGAQSLAQASETLSIELRLLSGLQPDFDDLEVSRAGDGFSVRGAGLSGGVSARAAKLDVYGGSPAAMQIAMRLACSLWLAPRGGLLLHGASIEADGRALALLGPSGAGKTTLATWMAASGAHVISDEVVCARWIEGAPLEARARLFGHPLPRRLGDGSAPLDGFPLGAIGLLGAHCAPGEGPRSSRLTPPQAARAILKRVFLPAAGLGLVESALATASALARAVPVFSLSVPNDARAAEAALSLLERA